MLLVVLPSGQSVKLTGSDGYSKTLTYDQVTSGGFNTYDTTGNPVTPQQILYSPWSIPRMELLWIVPLVLSRWVSSPVRIWLPMGVLWVKLLNKIDIVAAQ